MSDRIYTDSNELSTGNLVTVAQAAGKGLVLTKRNYPKHQVSYDQVKHFNFFEIELWNLWDLYLLSKRMLTKPRCCFLRAMIKDDNIRKHVVRKYKGQDATLVVQKQNWFALDIDGYGSCTGDLKTDAASVRQALPSVFRYAECFVVASSSYGIKPDIRMRMFFWAMRPVSGQDLKRLMDGNEAKADLAIFNPIQPIYTAAPIFHSMTDPIKERILWITPWGEYSPFVDVQSYGDNHRGAPEIKYTKKQALVIVENKLLEISELTSGERHDKLLDLTRLFGKLVWQGHIDEVETIDRAYDACGYWTGKRDLKKDMDTIRDGIRLGKLSMERGENNNEY